MYKVLAVAGMMTSLFLPVPVAQSSAVPAAKGVGVEILNLNGSGCKQGTAAVALSAARTAFTVTYSDYLAQAGGAAGKSDAGRECRMNLKISAPEGYAYAVNAVDYRGFAELAAGASASQYARYYFNGTTKPPYRVHPLAGPFSDYWQATDVGDSGTLLYGPCGGSNVLSIDTGLEVSPGIVDPSALSVVAMDSTDGSVRTTYRLAWKPCA